MFDFAWTEIAMIAVVALIAIGPKDMPVAIRAVTGAIKKARRMAGEFQTHVDEMVREANLDEVRTSFSELRNFDFKGEVKRSIDPDGTMNSAFNFDPDATTMVAERPAATPMPYDPDDAATAGYALDGERPAGDAPAFIPPQIASPPEPPAFIPPHLALRDRL